MKICYFSDFLFVFFTAQFWRLTNASKLECLYSSTWEFDNITWTIPSDDKEGYVEVKDSSNPGKVMMALSGEDVVLDDKAVKLTSSQLWIKGSENSDGYFTLKNIGTGKFLTLAFHKLNGDKTTLISVKSKNF